MVWVDLARAELEELSRFCPGQVWEEDTCYYLVPLGLARVVSTQTSGWRPGVKWSGGQRQRNMEKGRVG